MADNILNMRLRIIQLINQTLIDFNNDVINFGPALQRIGVAHDLSVQIDDNGFMLQRQMGLPVIMNNIQAEEAKSLCLRHLNNALLHIADNTLTEYLNNAMQIIQQIDDYYNDGNANNEMPELANEDDMDLY